MTLIEKLKNISKSISGNVIIIGLDYATVEDVIDKNDKINNLYIMNFKGKKRTRKIEKGYKRDKVISIKKIRKVFKKKKIDYIICNIDDVRKFLRSFIKNSVYINKNKLYIYGNNDNVDIELLENRYKRYTDDILITKYNNDILIEINNTNSYNNRLKDFCYHIFDIGYDIVDFIGNILVD